MSVLSLLELRLVERTLALAVKGEDVSGVVHLLTARDSVNEAGQPYESLLTTLKLEWSTTYSLSLRA